MTRRDRRGVAGLPDEPDRHDDDLVLTAIVARYGRDDIAAFGLGTRLDFLILMLAFGVGSAVLTLVGLAVGAGDLRRVEALLSRAVAVVAAPLAGLALLLVWRPTIWLALFTREPQILEIGTRYLRILAPSYPLLGVSMACSFAFQGLGRAVFPFVLVVLRTAVTVAAALALASSAASSDRIFALMACGNAASAAILYGRLRWVLHRR